VCKAGQFHVRNSRCACTVLEWALPGVRRHLAGAARTEHAHASLFTRSKALRYRSLLSHETFDTCTYSDESSKHHSGLWTLDAYTGIHTWRPVAGLWTFEHVAFKSRSNHTDMLLPCFYIRA